MTPTAAAGSWKSLQRALAAVFVIVVFSVLAFSVGRASAPTHHVAPTVVPASAPAAPAATAYPCHVGRAC